MKSVRIPLLLPVLAFAVAMPLSSDAVTFTINDALGRVVDGVAADAATDEAMVNSIVDRANGLATSTFDVAGKTYTVINDPAPILPLADFVVSGAVGGDNLVDLGTGGFQYLSVKYDGAQGSLLIFNISGLTGEVGVPSVDGNFGSNNYNLFNGAPANGVPDGGSAVALLGLAMVGAEGLRRKLGLAGTNA